jgi:hypothetical protein
VFHQIAQEHGGHRGLAGAALACHGNEKTQGDSSFDTLTRIRRPAPTPW